MNTGGLDPQAIGLWQQLERLTRAMRAAQRDYFKNRTQSSLLESKGLERKVDDLLIRMSYLAPAEPPAEDGTLPLDFGNPAA